jgi:hypothetical protein
MGILGFRECIDWMVKGFQSVNQFRGAVRGVAAPIGGPKLVPSQEQLAPLPLISGQLIQRSDWLSTPGSRVSGTGVAVDQRRRCDAATARHVLAIPGPGVRADQGPVSFFQVPIRAGSLASASGRGLEKLWLDTPPKAGLD